MTMSRFKFFTLGFLGILSFSLEPLSAMQTGLTHESNKRLSDGAMSGGPSESSWLSLDLVTANIKKRVDTYLNASARVYYGENNYLVSVPEAYVQVSGNRSNFSTGRKLVNWANEDKFWMLGNINGNKGMDLISDEQEGLLGFHYDYFSHTSDNGYMLSVMASPAFIPSLNPAYTFENGQVQSKAPWVQLPPERIRFRDNEIPINYTLDRPANSEIVRNNTLGVRVAKRWKSGGVQAFTMYKPENILRNYAEGKLSQDLESVSVRVRPAVNHHVVYGVDVDQKINKFRINGGLRVIDPNADLKADIKVVSPLALEKNDHYSIDSESFVISPSYKRQSYFHTGTSYLGTIWNGTVNYIKSLTDNESGDDFYGAKTKWHNAVGTIVDYFVTDKLSYIFDFKFDFDMRDNILKHEVKYMMSKALYVNVGLEMIKAPNKESYWNPYAAHDSVYSNLSYKF